VASQKDKATRAEGIRHAHGITHATSEEPVEESAEARNYVKELFRQVRDSHQRTTSPAEQLRPYTYERSYDDSPVGGITVKAMVRVSQLHFDMDEKSVVPFLHMELTVVADADTCDQPDVWSVTYYHFADMIMDGLEAYLKAYCPAPDQVWDTLSFFRYTYE
jgi:hypothetical protein